MATEGFFTDDHGTAKWNQDWTSPTEMIVNRKPYYATAPSERPSDDRTSSSTP